MLLTLQTDDRKLSCGGAKKKNKEEMIYRRLINVNVQNLSSLITHTHTHCYVLQNKMMEGVTDIKIFTT